MSDMDRRLLEEKGLLGGPGRLSGGGKTEALKEEQGLVNAKHAQAQHQCTSPHWTILLTMAHNFPDTHWL